jgi:predicted amidohydrolase
MKAIEAAAVQDAPVYLNLDASIAKAAEIVSEAARNGAKLVAFPETWLPGCPFSCGLAHPSRTRDIMPLVKRVQALPGNDLLRDLPLELNAVGTLSGHGFHPLKAQLTLSNH